MEKVIFEDPETGEKIEFIVEEQTTCNGSDYLLVSDSEGDEADAYILKMIQNGEDEITYEMVEDDTEFDALARIFSELLDEDTDLKY